MQTWPGGFVCWDRSRACGFGSGYLWHFAPLAGFFYHLPDGVSALEDDDPNFPADMGRSTHTHTCYAILTAVFPTTFTVTADADIQNLTPLPLPSPHAHPTLPYLPLRALPGYCELRVPAHRMPDRTTTVRLPLPHTHPTTCLRLPHTHATTVRAPRCACRITALTLYASRVAMPGLLPTHCHLTTHLRGSTCRDGSAF